MNPRFASNIFKVSFQLFEPKARFNVQQKHWLPWSHLLLDQILNQYCIAAL
jgi:hypothetical protein